MYEKVSIPNFAAGKKTISNFSVQKSNDYHLFRTKKYPVMNRTFFVRGDKGHIAITYKKLLSDTKLKIVSDIWLSLKRYRKSQQRKSDDHAHIQYELHRYYREITLAIK